jgi:hypothetical protein
MLKNITLSAEETLIEQARLIAQAEKTTLNAEFRHWLAQYVLRARTSADMAALMERLSYAQPGKTFTRSEMNER